MKKKILIKENELDNLVKNILNEREQLELELEGDENDTLASLMEGKYESIINEIRDEMSLFNSTMVQSSKLYEDMERIHSKEIFPLWRELDKIQNPGERTSIIIDKFHELEDNIVNWLETYTEWSRINEELEESTYELLRITNIEQ